MTDLLSQLERATEGSRELDLAIAKFRGLPRDIHFDDSDDTYWLDGWHWEPPHYTTNLQDAVSLAEAQGMSWQIDSEGEAWVWPPGTAWASDEAIGHDPVFAGDPPIPPALSVCIAIIKAHESKAEAA